MKLEWDDTVELASSVCVLPVHVGELGGAAYFKLRDTKPMKPAAALLKQVAPGASPLPERHTLDYTRR